MPWCHFVGPYWQKTFSTYLVDDTDRRLIQQLKAFARFADHDDDFRVAILGNEGNGKTHLLHAIAHEALASQRTQPSPLTVRIFDQPTFHLSVEHYWNGLPASRVCEIASHHGLILIDDVDAILEQDITNKGHLKRLLECRHVVVSATLPLPDFSNGGYLKQLLDSCSVFELRPPSREKRIQMCQRLEEQAGVTLGPDLARCFVEREWDGLAELMEAFELIAGLAKLLDRTPTIDDLPWINS